MSSDFPAENREDCMENEEKKLPEDFVPERPDYEQELTHILRSNATDEEIREKFEDYHENDIAAILEDLTPEERKKLYRILGNDLTSEIFTYVEDVGKYIEELDAEKAADIIESMDADDAVDILDELEEDKSDEIFQLMNEDARQDVTLIHSYDEDEIGSRMTTNFIEIRRGSTVRQAMKELVTQAAENDNITTLYVVEEDHTFYGAIDLKDLIIARENDSLSNIISRSYPSVYEHVKIADCIEDLTDYEEDSIPVLSENGTIAGILTANDIVELVDNAMGDDYAKLAGLTSEEDLNEPTFTSMKKRLPWLIILLFLGMAVSSVVGMFESVVAVLPIVICFQSLVLDMAGNVGTQSLAVTIRVLMDEDLSTKKKLSLLIKEMKIGFLNGASLGIMALLFLGIYIHYFKKYIWASAFLISGCVGISLIVAMVTSSFVGTIIPMFFHKIHIDPAVASGPLITTVNDLVAVITYYGLAMVFLINIFHI